MTSCALQYVGVLMELESKSLTAGGQQGALRRERDGVKGEKFVKFPVPKVYVG